MALNTTTWKDRNIHNLELTKQFAIEKGISEPVILNFGPGGTVKGLARSLPSGRNKEWSRAEKFSRAFFKLFESLVRKTDLFKLVTNEPAEIAAVFSELNPKMIFVADREKRVVQAALDLNESGRLKVPVDAVVKDMETGPLEKKGSIVVALNVVSRTGNRDLALSNIADSVDKGGLFCVNIDDAPEGFKKIGHCLFERIN